MNILRDKNRKIIWTSDKEVTVELYNKALTTKQRIYAATALGFATGVFILFLQSFTVKKWKPSGSSDQIEYVKRFSKTAIEEHKRFGIPASITLAQGLLESGAGKSKLAMKNNNHFGIKCFSRSCKKGHCSNFADDTHKDFFKVYQNPWQSYRDHSLFLQKEHYKALFQSGNIKKWCSGLEKLGYATDKNYSENLYNLIIKLNLDYFDEK